MNVPITKRDVARMVLRVVEELDNTIEELDSEFLEIHIHRAHVPAVLNPDGRLETYNVIFPGIVSVEADLLVVPSKSGKSRIWRMIEGRVYQYNPYRLTYVIPRRGRIRRVGD